MKEYDSVQDFIESSDAPKLFMQMLVDIAEMEGMPPDMIKDLRDRFDLHEKIKVKQNDN